ALTLDFLVLDHEELLDAGGGIANDAVERSFQLFRGERLDEVRESTSLQAMLTLLFHGDDLHRYVARAGILFEMTEHVPAQHVGEEDIERDGGWLVFPDERQGRAAKSADKSLETPVPHQAEQDAGVVGVVFDDEDARFAGFDFVPVVGHLL